jgi:Domain of unknown function (DUF5069)
LLAGIEGGEQGSPPLKKSLVFMTGGFHVPPMHWNDTFITIFERCAKDYGNGGFDYRKDYTGDELAFLESIGYKRREFFDFIEDFVDEGEPSVGTALLIAAVRRDYFQAEQKGSLSNREVTKNDLPSFGEEFEGMAYLPRILVKARAKLRGELDPDLMFGCGGDRNFLSKNGGIHPADFLRRVWAAGDDDSKVALWIKSH